MMFAQSFFDFGVSENVLQIVKIIGAVGGAVIGWLVSDPLTRLAYRVSFKGATPASVLLFSKLAGATGLALLIYISIQLGGGGGFGFGPGQGGSPGKGKGQGGDKGIVATDGKDKQPAKDKTDVDVKPGKTSETIEIEIINVKRFGDVENERYYLLRLAEPAVTLAKIEELFKKGPAKIEIAPILTRDSIGEVGEGNPLSQLLELTKKYKVRTMQTKGP
ncbi:MAG: hypothetical protein EXR98_15330 [Gemmataceae bacterium]|nr:hypothetical protein [Gemmataceae bacterium]